MAAGDRLQDPRRGCRRGQEARQTVSSGQSRGLPAGGDCGAAGCGADRAATRSSPGRRPGIDIVAAGCGADRAATRSGRQGGRASGRGHLIGVWRSTGDPVTQKSLPRCGSGSSWVTRVLMALTLPAATAAGNPGDWPFEGRLSGMPRLRGGPRGAVAVAELLRVSPSPMSWGAVSELSADRAGSSGLSVDRAGAIGAIGGPAGLSGLSADPRGCRGYRRTRGVIGGVGGPRCVGSRAGGGGCRAPAPAPRRSR